MPIDDRPIVYTTADQGRERCKKCHQSPCRCPKQLSLPPEKQTAHIQREKKGRGGKTVIVIWNLQLSKDDLKHLGQKLRCTCGSGGAVKKGTIEIQGDHREKIVATLRELGYKVKIIGG
jgi:translation initiation factor 1